MNEKAFCPGGYAYVTEKIRAAVADESRTAVITGAWEIDEAIRLPSHFTLILEDCHLRMADGCYANMFVNEHHDTPVGRTVEGTDHNINILGRKQAILDGGTYNGLSERNHNRDGLPPIWKNNLLFFTNVDGFCISGISCRNQRWWALNFIYCAHGVIQDVDFCACDIGIDADGNAYHGLLRSKYKEVLVKNADGIDLRQGCHDIRIENITGFTEDDSVALTALNGFERAFAVEGLPTDLCHIEIKNIRTAAFCTNVRLLNKDGIKLHDVCIDGVYDESPSSPHLDHGIFAVRVGDSDYGTTPAAKGDTYNIEIKNVIGRSHCAVNLVGEIDNLVMYGIQAESGTKMLLDERKAT